MSINDPISDSVKYNFLSHSLDPSENISVKEKHKESSRLIKYV